MVYGYVEIHNEVFAKLLQIFWLYSCQIDPDDAVSDVFIQRCCWVFLQVSVFPAQVVQTCLLIPDQMSAAKLILVDQLHRIRRQSIKECWKAF